MTKIIVSLEYGYRHYVVTTSLSKTALYDWWRKIVPVERDTASPLNSAKVDLFESLPGHTCVPCAEKEKHNKKTVYCRLHEADDSDMDCIIPDNWYDARSNGSMPEDAIIVELTPWHMRPEWR